MATTFGYRVWLHDASEPLHRQDWPWPAVEVTAVRQIDLFCLNGATVQVPVPEGTVPLLRTRCVTDFAGTAEQWLAFVAFHNPQLGTTKVKWISAHGRTHWTDGFSASPFHAPAAYDNELAAGVPEHL